MLDTTKLHGHKAEDIKLEADSAYDLHTEYGEYGALYDIYFFDGDEKHKLASIEELTNSDPKQETDKRRTLVTYEVEWGEEDKQLSQARSKLESIVHSV